jgi:YggT family protein
VGVVWQVLSLIVWLFILLLIGRLVLDWIQNFARDWRPRGVVLVVAEGIYSATDPPLRALRKVIHPIPIGSIRIDLAFMVLFVIALVLLSVLSRLPA